MYIYQPAYYKSFHCIASACPDPCCKDWDIEVDPKTAAFYKSIPGDLGNQIRSALYEDPDYGTTISLKGGRCPLWRADGLCGIQYALGEDALCDVCKTFPRLHHDFGTFMEYGLELSCPEAARIILTNADFTWEKSEADGDSLPEYDADAMALLQETRKQATAIVTDFAHTVPETLTLLLFYGYRVQALLDGEESPELNAEKHLAAAASLQEPAAPKEFLNFFKELEILTPEWERRLSAPAPKPEWCEAYRNLMQYGIQRYWLQAVSDYDLLSRVKFIVISCLLIHLLGGNLISTAQLFSKEIENDTDNVDAILDGAYSSPALTDKKLLALLK